MGTMRRREFVTLLGGASVAWPFAAMAQQAGRTYRFGMLYPAVADPVMAAFLEGLRRHGFTEGQTSPSITAYLRGTLI